MPLMKFFLFLIYRVQVWMNTLDVRCEMEKKKIVVALNEDWKEFFEGKKLEIKSPLKSMLEATTLRIFDGEKLLGEFAQYMYWRYIGADEE